MRRKASRAPSVRMPAEGGRVPSARINFCKDVIRLYPYIQMDSTKSDTVNPSPGSTEPTMCLSLNLKNKVCQARRRKIAPTFSKSKKGEFFLLCDACRSYDRQKRNEHVAEMNKEAEAIGMRFCDICRRSREPSLFEKKTPGAFYKRCKDCRDKGKEVQRRRKQIERSQ